MKLLVDSYDALGTLMPAESLEVVSSFACDWRDDFMPEPIVLGIWVRRKNNVVESRYLSAAQRDKAIQACETTE